MKRARKRGSVQGKGEKAMERRSGRGQSEVVIKLQSITQNKIPKSPEGVSYVKESQPTGRRGK